MKSFYSIFVLILILFSKITSAQTIIDYENWNVSSPPCNIFGTEVPVNGLNHKTTVGTPTLAADNSIELEERFISSGNFKGTEYAIEYNFKKGYSYKVEIKCKIITNVTNGGYTLIRGKLQSSGFGGNTDCTGPNTIDMNTANNEIVSAIVSKDNYSTSTLNFNNLNQGYSHILMAAVGTISQTQFIHVAKITITETLTATFNPMPSTVTVTCGNPLTQTFTVTPGDISGVTSYIWNLGSANPNWTYNNAPAQQTITTTTNSLTLTSTCGSFPNITVTIFANGVNYQTKTITINTEKPSLYIAGSFAFCNSASYSISGLPCSATIDSWTASPTGKVTISGTNPVTVTKVTDGDFTLTANITMCGKPFTVTRALHSGNLPVVLNATQTSCNEIGYVVTGTDATSYSWTRNYGDILFGGTSTAASTSIPEIATTGTSGSISVATTNLCGSSVTITKVFNPFSREIVMSGSSPLLHGDQLSVSIDPPIDFVNNYKWYVNNNLVAEGPYQTSYCTCYGSSSDDPRVCGYNNVSLEVETNCGTIQVGYMEFEWLCSRTMNTSNVELFPNPAKDFLTIRLKSLNTKDATSKLKDIRQVRVIDKMGRIIRERKFMKGSASVQLNLIGLPADNYIIEVFDGLNKINIHFNKVK